MQAKGQRILIKDFVPIVPVRLRGLGLGNKSGLGVLGFGVLGSKVYVGV